MKIGIIGSGNIGGNLGLHLTNAGHQVLFSSRHPDELTDLLKEAGDKAKVGNVEEAAEFGEVLILAVPFNAIEELSKKLSPLKDKIIIETTNPYPERDGEIAEKVRKSDKPASVYVADQFPEAHVVKAFNTIYYKHLQDQPFRGGDRRAIPFAGDHEPSLEVVRELIEQIGFAAVYVGPLSESHPMDVGNALYNKDLTAEEAYDILKK